MKTSPFENKKNRMLQAFPSFNIINHSERWKNATNHNKA